MKPNPFRPGAASAPVVLVGRDDHLAAFAARMQESVSGYNGRSPLLHGLRGIGKTVLLNTMVDQARPAGWAATRVEASSHTSLVVDLVARSEELLEPFAKAGRRAWERIRDTVTEITAGAGPAKVTVKLDRRANRPPDPTGDVLSVVFGPVAAASQSARRGVALMVDELQAASEPDVAALARLIQYVQSERLPLLVTSAGLPSARNAIARASYAERFEFFPLDYLSVDETVFAFSAPAAQEGTTFTPDALDRLLDVSGGYPYFIQLYGRHTWAAAGGADTITLDHVHLGERAAWRDLDQSMFGLRWNRVPDGERRFLIALAAAGAAAGNNEVPTAEVNRLLESTGPAQSAVRARLIERGLIYGDEGRVGFTLPGFATYVTARARQPGGALPPPQALSTANPAPGLDRSSLPGGRDAPGRGRSR